jgi:hypothetical protein
MYTQISLLIIQEFSNLKFQRNSNDFLRVCAKEYTDMSSKGTYVIHSLDRPWEKCVTDISSRTYRNRLNEANLRTELHSDHVKRPIKLWLKQAVPSTAHQAYLPVAEIFSATDLSIQTSITTTTMIMATTTAATVVIIIAIIIIITWCHREIWGSNGDWYE